MKPNGNDIIKENAERGRKTYWDGILVQASIAAMQGIQESGKLGMVADIMPKELAELSVRIGEALVEELKHKIDK